jgi:diguanylate cyclase (GGDEF)-like protein
MNEVIKTLRKRYLLALSIIAILVLGSQFVIQYTVQLEADDSRIINIAGRQRMLSQRITKCSLAYSQGFNSKEKLQYFEELKLSVALWERSHIGLQYGDEEVGLPGRNSKEVMKLFANADPYFQSILHAAKQILYEEKNKDENINDNINIIKKNEQSFLKIMDSIVFQYDSEAKNKVLGIRILEFMIMIFTFILLGLEVRFIFFPAERSIQKSFDEVNESNDNIHKLFEIAPTALFIMHQKDLSIIKMNMLAKTYAFEGFSEVESNSLFNGVESNSLFDFFDKNLENSKELAKKMLEGEAFSQEEALLKTKYSIRAVLVSATKMQYQHASAIIVSMMDISKQKQAESILRKYATIDELTGLLNRRSGKTILDTALDRAKTEKNDIGVCFCDIDSLKVVNDQFGHEEGDWYIKSVAEAIKENLREDDFAFRYGGDEIIIVINGCSEDIIKIIIDRIKDSIRQKKINYEKSYEMSVSAGIVNYYSKEETTSDDLIAKADLLMYEEKRRNKMAKRTS